MTFHGHGYLRLALPSNAVPVTGNVHSGFGFRSSQDSALLFHRESPVRPPAPSGAAGRGWWPEGGSLGPRPGPLTQPLSPDRAMRGVPAAGPRDPPACKD